MPPRMKVSRNVWILGLTSLFNDTSSEMIHAVLPLFLVSTLSADVALVGLIEGMAEATASILKIFSGAISDYWQRRKELAVFGYGLSTAVKPLFIVASSPLWVLLARVGDRIGKGIRVAPRDALVADSTDASNRGAAYGLRQSLDTIGAFLGPLLAFGFLSTGQSFRFIFTVALVPGILAVLCLAVGIHEPRQPYHTLSRPNPLNFQALKSLGTAYWGLAIAALLFNLGNSSEAFLQLKAKQVMIPDAHIPLVLVVMNLSYALSAYPVGVLSDRVNRKTLLILGWSLNALIYLGLAFSQTYWQVWLLIASYGLYMGMTQGVLLAMVADRVPEHLRGTAFGFLNLMVGFALLPASFLAGWLWQTVSPESAFLVGSGFAVAGIVLLSLQQQTELGI
ncbi:MFS transporter [Planktothrix mougeotii]|uniref:MFS transporter n=1 Tax=Planktothrix mougeotii LEGE 06226 TaxID=1828728 RepID=A0ABR9UC66_9CYAN|nr:MFS transporter [Planktothrix mougeotii]MBE9144055.1 MFS transporter [Planktothrix mougeotii LEGE 06226]